MYIYMPPGVELSTPLPEHRICIYMYVCIHIFIHKCINININICISIHIYLNIYAYV